MDFEIRGNVITASFQTILQLCLFFITEEYEIWDTRDKQQVPEIHHQEIQTMFEEALSFLLNIEDDDDAQSQFEQFDVMMGEIKATIESLK
jgi:hypothetical protein